MKKYKLLVVDDDKDFLGLISANFIKEERLDVKLENNPIKAIDLLKNGKYDILFVDYYMPQMTGEEFVNELRKFDKDIFVILQTGYSGNKPAKKMLELMNIQGYFDKLESLDKLDLLIKSTVKTLDLIEEIKKKDSKIDYITYKNNLMGELIVELADGLKDQIATIDIAARLVKDEKISKAKETIPAIVRSNGRLRKLLNAMDFNTNKDSELKTVIEKVKILTESKLKVEEATLNLNMVENELLEVDSSVLIVVLIKCIVILLNKNCKEIDIQIEILKSKVYITINNANESIIEEIKKINLPDNNAIKINSYVDNKLKFFIA